MTFLRLFILFAATITGVSAAVIPFQLQTRSHIRVRIAESASFVSLSGYDLRFYQRVSAGSPSRSRTPASMDLKMTLNRQSEWQIRCQDGRIRAQRMDSAIGSSSVDLQEPVSVQSPSGFLKYAGKPYREELQIRSVGSLCEVVNEVDLEKYLEGLVNTEFSSKWNEESIGAQVVAARTYALYQVRQARIQDLNYDVDGSTSDQVYDGSIREDANAARVVSKTRGLVLTTGAGNTLTPLKAFYHSTCGGATELPERVWGTPSNGFHHGVQCPFCSHSPAAHWALDVSENQIETSLRRVIKNEGAPSDWPKNWRQTLQGRVIGLRTDGFDSSGRVNRVAISFQGISGKNAGELFLSGVKFREVIGVAQFKSAAFQVQISAFGRNARWHFEGRGNGHGVGMCQWGAKVMGEKGYKTASILKFYYPDATLRKLW